MPTKDFTHKLSTGIGYGPNIAVQSQAFGQRNAAVGLSNSPSNDGAVQPAGLFSTAPYVGRKKVGTSVQLFKIEAIREDVLYDERHGKCYAKDDTCTAWGTKKYDGLCNAHGRIAAGLSAYSPKGG